MTVSQIVLTLNGTVLTVAGLILLFLREEGKNQISIVIFKQKIESTTSGVAILALGCFMFVVAFLLPNKTPEPVIPIKPPDSLPSQGTVTVDAQLKWQASGIEVKKGDSLQLTYISGKWRERDDAAAVDPLGSNPQSDDVADPECKFPMLPSIAGLNALIAKIGENGKPFNPFKTTRKGEGMLYLRMNDCDKYLTDNSGFVIVKVQLNADIGKSAY